MTASLPTGSLALLFLGVMLAAAPASAQPEMDFAATPESGTNPLDVTFTGSVTGGFGFNWIWDFGDGSSTVGPASVVQHTYLAPGSYTVTATVQAISDGQLFNETVIKVDYVNVAPAPLDVGFSASPLEGVNVHTVHFTNTTTGPVTDWLWDFGDGTTSSAENPSHTYQLPGTFSVSLTAFVAEQQQTVLAPELVTVRPAALTAGFTASGTEGLQPLPVEFTNTSSGDGITGWLWDFGDGNTSTEEHPVHVYAVQDAGLFTVSLTAFVGQQQDTFVSEDLVRVATWPLTCDFDMDVSVGATPFEVSFTDLSEGEIEGWLWEFGDGASSNERNPVHTYAPLDEPTTYAVRLTVSIGGQAEVQSRTVLATPSMAPEVIATPERVFASETGDLDGDGDPDVVVGLSFEDGWGVPLIQLAWLENLDGDGSLGPAQILYTYARQSGLPRFVAVDVDADDDLDILYLYSDLNGTLYLENLDGAGTFSSTPVWMGGSSLPFETILDHEFVDFDGDGACDLLYATSSGVFLRRNDGSGTPLDPIGLGSPNRLVAAADVDADGDYDLLCGRVMPRSIGWLQNLDGATDFGPFQAVGEYPLSALDDARVSPADMDGDGDVDLFAATEVSTGWYSNRDGAGDFASYTEIAEEFLSPAIVDVDLDGDLDLLDCWTWDRELLFYENVDGFGDFAEPVVLATSATAWIRAGTADLDGDQDADVVMLPVGVSQLTVLENRIGFGVWVDLGNGLAGTVGIPHLEAAGELAGGEPVSLRLRRALPESSAYLVLGLSAVNAPFRGGVLVPSPDVLLAGLPIDADGRLVFDLLWPAGVPGNTSLYFQYWIVDEQAPAGLSSSNGLEGVTRP